MLLARDVNGALGFPSEGICFWVEERSMNGESPEDAHPSPCNNDGGRIGCRAEA